MKNTQNEKDNSFQPNQLCTQLKIMKALEDDTDYKLKTLKERERSLLEADPDARRENLKVYSHSFYMSVFQFVGNNYLLYRIASTEMILSETSRRVGSAWRVTSERWRKR